MMRWVRAAVRSWVQPGSGRNPQHLTDRIGEDLDVHSVPALLGPVVGSAVADAVALGESAAQEDELRIVLAQGLEQVRGPFGEQAGHGGDVRVGGADGYHKDGRDPGEGIVAAQVHQSDERALVRREFAPSVILTGDDEHRDPLDQAMRGVECDRIGNQQGSCADGLRLLTLTPTAREPCALRPSPQPHRRHQISDHSENAQ